MASGFSPPVPSSHIIFSSLAGGYTPTCLPPMIGSSQPLEDCPSHSYTPLTYEIISSTKISMFPYGFCDTVRFLPSGSPGARLLSLTGDT